MNGFDITMDITWILQPGKKVETTPHRADSSRASCSHFNEIPLIVEIES